jgi:hypothetical protein
MFLSTIFVISWRRPKAETYNKIVAVTSCLSWKLPIQLLYTSQAGFCLIILSKTTFSDMNIEKWTKWGMEWSAGILKRTRPKRYASIRMVILTPERFGNHNIYHRMITLFTNLHYLLPVATNLFLNQIIMYRQTDKQRFGQIDHFRYIRYSASASQLGCCEAEHHRNIFLFPWVSV